MNLNNVDFETYFKHYPNNEGYFGKFGGAYVSPELKKAMEEITEAYFTIFDFGCIIRGRLCRKER